MRCGELNLPAQGPEDIAEPPNRGLWCQRDRYRTYQATSALQGTRVSNKTCKNLKVNYIALKRKKKLKVFSSFHIRVRTIVCNIVDRDICGMEDYLKKESFEFCSMIFFLSAIQPEEVPKVLQRIDQLMKPSKKPFFSLFAQKITNNIIIFT